METPAGPRVTLGALWAALNEHERFLWNGYAGRPTLDEHGLAPAGVEEFLEYAERPRQQPLF